ncbi:PilZ domain-containing protein [Myxococcota bacterium]
MTEHVAGVLWVEKRGAARYEATLEVLFVSQGRLMRATGMDISMTGMRITSAVELDIGTQLQVHFAPPGKAVMRQLVGRVAWARPSSEAAGSYEMGLAFGTLPQETNDELARLTHVLGEETDDLPMADEEDVLPMAAGSTRRFASDPESLLGMPPDDVGIGELALDDNGGESFSDGFESPLAGEAPPDDDTWVVSQKLLEDALAEDKQAHTKDIGTADQLIAKARVAYQRGEIEQAIEMLNRATILVPDSPEAHEELASMLYLNGDVRESAQLFDRALRLRLEKGEGD